MTQTMPTDRELEALKVLWEEGEATVRAVCDAIGESGEQLAYTTVLSLLQVMEQKGFLQRVFDGSLDQYLIHALGSRRVTRAELDQLEAMIATARKPSDPKPNRGPRRKQGKKR